MTTTAMVLYDGDCGFCTWTAQNGHRMLPAEVQIVPYQQADLEKLGVTSEAAASAVQWITPGEEPRAGHKAIAAWLVASGPPWSLAGYVLRTPPTSWLAAAVYKLVARYRHLIRGPWQTCRV